MKQFSCFGLRERLEEYLDGELPSALRAAVEAHLSQCAACRTLAVHEQSVLHGIRDSLRATPAPSWLEARVSAAIAFTANVAREEAAR
jgi:anti-sigma factor (TIGR02949 family)